MKAENLKVVIADTEALKESAFSIRKEVFVVEQEVSHADEFDEFEDISTHFVAMINNEAVGAARWRPTDKGIKLERFAVSKDFRGKGVGSALVKAVIEDIQQRHPEAYLYMHAQLEAIPLYLKFGFQKTGPQFEECNIQHFKMERSLNPST